MSHKTEALGKEPVPLRRIWECLQTCCFQINLSITKHLLYLWQWYPGVYEKDTYLSSMLVWYDVSKVLRFWKHQYPWHLERVCVFACVSESLLKLCIILYYSDFGEVKVFKKSHRNRHVHQLLSFKRSKWLLHFSSGNPQHSSHRFQEYL